MKFKLNIQLLSKYKHGNNIHEHLSKKNNANKFASDSSQRLDLRSSSIYVSPQNLCVSYTSKRVKQEHKNKDLKT